MDVLRIVGQHPGAPEWRASVARFAGAVGRGRVDKVVLARRSDLQASRPIELGPLLERLLAAGPGSTTFAVTRDDRAFVGSSPEQLVWLEGRALRTVAMAGSTRRGPDDDGDRLLAAELLASDKEHEEHAVVVDVLRATLSPISDDLMVADKPEVLCLRHVQHLVTPIQAELADAHGILALVELLHPTPAVAGAPRELALELIEEEESAERGWYAGPIGWLDRHCDGEFVVALRSGVVEGNTASLFAGCGIVADSDPDREWAESQTKLRALGSALGTVEA